MRDAIIIGIACLVAIVVGAGLYFMDAKAPENAVRSVETRVIGEGEYAASVDSRTNYRLRSMDELSELWTMAYGAAGPLIPSIDFAKEEVLAVFDGSHSSGGYGVFVESVTDGPLSRTVSLVRFEPGSSCMTASALSSPFQIVVVPRSELPLTREERTEVRDCQ